MNVHDRENLAIPEIPAEIVTLAAKGLRLSQLADKYKHDGMDYLKQHHPDMVVQFFSEVLPKAKADPEGTQIADFWIGGYREALAAGEIAKAEAMGMVIQGRHFLEAANALRDLHHHLLAARFSGMIGAEGGRMVFEDGKFSVIAISEAEANSAIESLEEQSDAKTMGDYMKTSEAIKKIANKLTPEDIWMA